ncbi:MAG: hypothetical protein Q4B72_11670 [Lachnospiraceae bacterium]|nr:hypothetical protein [Lachnospiraceae bacterium]
MRKERKNGARLGDRGRWLAMLLGVCMIVMMLPAAAIANDDIMDLKPNPDNPTLYEANISLDIGDYAYNNSRSLVLPESALKTEEHIWTLDRPDLINLDTQDKYYDYWGCYRNAHTKKDSGVAIVTCTYTVDDVEYTCIFTISVGFQDINDNGNLSFTLEDTEKIYDSGSLHPSEPQRVDPNDGEPSDVVFEYSIDGGSTWVKRELISITNVSESAEVKVRASMPGFYTGYKYDTQKLSVLERPIIIESRTLSKEYDGNPLTNGDTSVEIGGMGWVYGEGAKYEFSGSQTLVGSSKNHFKIEPNQRTDLNNYKLTKITGNLKVTDRTDKFEIAVNANSGTFVCDGKEKTVSGFETLNFTVNGNEFTVSGLSAEGSGTKAGTYPVEITGTPVVSDAEGNDVSNQFDVTAVDGTLTITADSDSSSGSGSDGHSGNDSAKGTGSPITNDSSNLSLWIMLCAVSLAGTAGSIVYSRRKN